MKIKEFLKYLDINARICLETERGETLYQGKVCDINIALFEDLEITDINRLMISGGIKYLLLKVEQDIQELFKDTFLTNVAAEGYKNSYMEKIERLKKLNIYSKYLDWLREDGFYSCN